MLSDYKSLLDLLNIHLIIILHLSLEGLEDLSIFKYYQPISINPYFLISFYVNILELDVLREVGLIIRGLTIFLSIFKNDFHDILCLLVLNIDRPFKNNY